ncbi:GntR family transcriptional regulator [Paenalcaligenes niemegkensis]|uniref:GntR family transcriptional regulator n=1 Tax=Paenalcaligenes niemegkensis TaxID=2895469 RepID=UPI001EE992FF|nr:GntR family transcriptional regulator [Paenalcaligenes niemegkensis]MCQ9615751.1 GntR family transcriptional regulator [Paenalcaligenes niemegkensis]
MFTISAIERSGHGSASAQIGHELTLDIMAGRLAPGDRLAEVALAERFDISRGPVREALRYLASIGLVTFTPNIGASVRVMSVSDAKALYEVRAALESEAARLAALRVDARAKDELRHVLQQHKESVAKHPSGAYLQRGGDNDFHSLIARLSGNYLIEQALGQELYPQLVLLRAQHKKVQGRGQIALVEHQRIVEAIIEKDSELAAMLMRRHLTASYTSFLGQIQGEAE